MSEAPSVAPSCADIEAIARRTLEALPAPFADHLGDVVLFIEEFADEETLDAMGIEDPFELTGIYEGIPISEKSISLSGTLPDRIRLFRRPILDEWACGEDSLEQLVAHPHELDRCVDRQFANLRVPGRRGFKELEQRGKAFLGV